MSRIFKVGKTYIAKGFSNYGSVVRVKILGRSEKTVRVGCDILFRDSARRRIMIDEEGNEFLNLGKGFTVSSLDIDKDFSAIHEAQSLQDDILRDTIVGRADIQSLVEDVVDGLDDGVHLVQPGKGYGTYDTDADWSERDYDTNMEKFFVEEMEWNRPTPVRIPERLEIELPDNIIDTDEEPEAVNEAVLAELRRLGIIYHFDELAGYELVSYKLTEAPVYEFDEKDLDMGLSDLMAGDISSVNSLDGRYANSILGSIR